MKQQPDTLTVSMTPVPPEVTMSLFSRSRLLLRLPARHAPWAWARADSTAAASAAAPAASAGGQDPVLPETSVDMPTFDMENPFKVRTLVVMLYGRRKQALL